MYATARNLGASKLELTLWVPRVHGPFTTGLLNRAKSMYFHNEWFLICVWKGLCGDSARCEDSAGIDGVVYGADIYRCSSVCQRSVRDWARPQPLWHNRIGYAITSHVSLCRIEN